MRSLSDRETDSTQQIGVLMHCCRRVATNADNIVPTRTIRRCGTRNVP